MHPSKGTGSESLADILLNKHVMPPPARKWIVKARPQKLTADPTGLPGPPYSGSTKINGDPGCGASNVGRDMEHHGKLSRSSAPGAPHATAWRCKSVSSSSPAKAPFWTIWKEA